MSKRPVFSIEILKEALNEEFGERDSFATFERGRVRVDLAGFFASDEGKKELERFAKEREMSKAVSKNQK